MASKKKTKNVDEKKVKSVKADELNQKVMADEKSTVEKKETVAVDAVMTKDVVADTVAKENVEAVERYGTVISNRLNVRKGPNKTADIVKVISKGDKVEIIKLVNDEWYEIVGGFVMKAFIDG